MASCSVDQKRTLKEHFKQLAVIKLCPNSGVMPQKHGIILVRIIVGKCVLGRLFLSGTSNFGMVERTSATIFGVRDCIPDSAKNVQILASRYTVPEQRRVEICS